MTERLTFTSMRLNLSESRLGETAKVAEGVYVIKTMVGIGEGGGHLTHDGLRQRFLLNLQDGREGEILQVQGTLSASPVLSAASVL